jgi:NADPH:quinone reductase-like Zn-dependent oxidoreductase
MNAIRMHSYGGPEVLQCEEAPRPQVQKGELLIRVHAAGVNPLDWKVRADDLKGFIQHKLPLIPGWDVSRIVEELGPGPAAAGQFMKGDEVFAIADPTRDGAYADYIRFTEPPSGLNLSPSITCVPRLCRWRRLQDADHCSISASSNRDNVFSFTAGPAASAISLCNLQSGKAPMS